MTERTNPPICTCSTDAINMCPVCRAAQECPPSPTDDPARLLDACRYPEPVPTMHDKGTPISVGYEATFKLIARLVRQRDDLERTAQAAEEMRDKADAELARLRMGHPSPMPNEAWIREQFEDIVFDADALMKFAPENCHPAILGIRCVAANALGGLTGGAKVDPEHRWTCYHDPRCATEAEHNERRAPRSANPKDAADELTVHMQATGEYDDK